ncbi:MAG: hypothetical protein ABIR39_10120 [Nocardioides sp.]|uniref:hypothetical protein n=1 Tax=Nocardioides sp. TaxID=35761 RepID=UPI003263DF6E
MTTSDLERRLTVLLGERADAAMEQTSTQTRLADLLVTRGRDTSQRRRRWVAGGLAVAAATAAVALWFSSGDEERAEPTPATVDSVQIATDFLEAVYSHDADLATSFLSPGVRITHARTVGTVTESEWVDELAWQEAIGATLVDHSCRAVEANEVTCTYSMHGLGSDQLNHRPYDDNTLDLTIRDGLVEAFQDEWRYMDNGFSAEMWEPFAAWIVREHPGDVRAMYTDEGQNLPRLDPTSVRRWEQRVAEWVGTRR